MRLKLTIYLANREVQLKLFDGKKKSKSEFLGKGRYKRKSSWQVKEIPKMRLLADRKRYRDKDS